MTKKISTFDVLNVLLMLIVIFVTFYPFLYIINVSFSGDLYVYRNEVSFWPKGFTLKNYEYVLNNDKIWSGYKNTIIYTVIGTTISLLVTSSGAFALSRKQMVFRKSLMLAIIFTILFGGGMIPAYLVAKAIGILNTMWAIILPGAVSAFNLIIFRTFFSGLPEDLFDAGRMDGLSDIGIFVRIVMPLSKAVFAAIGLFVAVGLWNDYYKTAIYIRNSDLFPLSAVLRELIIQGGIDQAASTASNLPGGAPEPTKGLKYATLMASTLPILVVYPFLQKHFAKGVLIGSVKQ